MPCPSSIGERVAAVLRDAHSLTRAQREDLALDMLKAIEPADPPTFLHEAGVDPALITIRGTHVRLFNQWVPCT